MVLMIAISLLAATRRFWNESTWRGYYVHTWPLPICSGAAYMFSLASPLYDSFTFAFPPTNQLIQTQPNNLVIVLF